MLPHERWIADRAIRNADAKEGSEKWRLHQNYGTRGVSLEVAGALDVILGFALALIGIILIAASKGDGVLGTVGTVIVFGGVVVILFGLVRLAQCVAAGRRFRNGRAFIRRSS